MLVTSDVKLRNDNEICNSVHPVMMELLSKEHVEKLKHRYYKLPNGRKYELMYGNEYHLVGQTIMLKSPITCASEEGICRQCYGELFDVNSTLNSAGGLSATKISEPVTQNILSAKHLLATDSELIEFNSDDFFLYFNIFANEVMVDHESDAVIGATLLIVAEEVTVVDQYETEFDNDDTTGFDASIKEFYVRDNKGNIREFFDVSGKELFISPDVAKRIMKKVEKVKNNDEETETRTFIEIPLTSIDASACVFAFEINNNELTKPLYDIMNLLNNKKERAKAGIETIDQAAQRLLDLLIISEIPADSIHGEMILRSLIRSKEDVLGFPDFTRYDALADVQIMTILSALSNHPSVTVSLSFQYLLTQLENPLTYRKNEGSYLDPFFKKTL